MTATMTTTTERDGPGSGFVVPDEMLDRVIAGVEAGTFELLGADGVIAELSRQFLQRALDVELTDHLGYERGDPAGRKSGNNRNGTTPKTVLTSVGAIDLDVPRDRVGSFDPKIVCRLPPPPPRPPAHPRATTSGGRGTSRAPQPDRPRRTTKEVETSTPVKGWGPGLWAAGTPPLACLRVGQFLLDSRGLP